MSECNVKISLLEKKVESIDSEIARHVGIEKKETEKIQQELVNQEKYVCPPCTVHVHVCGMCIHVRVFLWHVHVK